MNSKSPVYQGIIIGVTAGLILVSIQNILDGIESKLVRGIERELVRDNLHALVDGALSDQVTSSFENLQILYVQHVADVLATLLTHGSSHLNASDRMNLDGFRREIRRLHLNNADPITVARSARSSRNLSSSLIRNANTNRSPAFLYTLRTRIDGMVLDRFATRNSPYF